MDGPTPRILVVDDNEALRENIAECLADEGWQVTLASSAQEALRSLERAPLPRIAIVDLRMPGAMDGRALIDAIRQDPRLAEVRVVLSTGDGLSQRQVPGADAVLPKPFGVKELLQTIAALAPAP
jgi:CheY-like chemotaxis protein